MSEEFTSQGLKDVIMSLEEELAEIKKEPAGDEAMVDYFGRDEGDNVDDGDGDGYNDDPSDDLEYEPRRKLRRRQLTGTLQGGRGVRNMTYSHEQRIRMGFYGAQWGIKAMKKEFPGVKDSTARDMCNCVMTIVRDGVLTLDLPLDKQDLPPKMRNGMPQSGKQTKEKSPSSGPNSAEPGPSLEPVHNGTGEALSHQEVGKLPASDVSVEAADRFVPPKPAGKSPSPVLSFQDRVKIGFVAANEGSSVAVKKCEVSDTTVRECRNVVIRLIQSGRLSDSVPLGEQEIPAQNPEETGAARPARRGRPPKNTFGRFTSPTEAKTNLGSFRMTTPNSPPQTEPPPPISENPSEVLPSPNPGPAISSLSPSPTPNPRFDHVQLHRGTRDIFLGSDLAFLRWRNIRTSLGFQTDEAFAMHLMDVHDAFCSTSCRDGGRNEYPAELR